MTTTHAFTDGAPCWVDLSTPDLAGARRFYGELLGWTFDEPRAEFAGYVNARRDGRLVAGVMPSPPGSGMPAAWGVHLKSSDLDETARRIPGAGGAVVMPRHPVGTLGSMLLATDPTGAFFGVWEPAGHRGAELFDEPGAMCWHEVNTRDPDATDAFYSAVFGHDPLRHTCDEIDYAMYQRDGRIVAGRMKMTADWGDAPPHWLTYFVVAHADAAVDRVRALGGKLVAGPVDSPHGRSAVVADPYGAAFAIIQRPADTTCPHANDA